jgi:hypothetical protein
MEGVIPGTSGSGTGWSSTRPMADMGSARGKSWVDPDELDGNYATRIHRTVRVSLPPGGRDYNRGSFAQRVEETCGLDKLEACGPMAAGHIWMLTFSNIDAKERFANAGDFKTREGAEARVSAVKKQRHAVRVHWVPFHVPMKAIVKAFERYPELTVTSASYDKSVIEGLKHVNSLIRTLWIETENPQSIPHAINWHSDGQTGQALVTMKNRAPVCLRCFEGGHLRKNCPLNVKCRVCFQAGHDDPLCTQTRSWASRTAGTTRTVENEEARKRFAESIPDANVPDQLMEESETPIHTENSGNDQNREDVTVFKVTSPVAIHVSTPVAEATPSPPNQGNNQSETSRTAGTPQRVAQEGGATSASTLLNAEEWPTLREAQLPPAERVVLEGTTSDPGVSIELTSIPDTQQWIYKAFFSEFGHIFVSIANSQYQYELALSQRTGIINLLPKKNGDLHFLANRRPISLLNVDYKILSKSLVNRLKLVATKIIGSSQSAAIPNRSIFDALHLLRNILSYCKERDIPCLALY